MGFDGFVCLLAAQIYSYVYLIWKRIQVILTAPLLCLPVGIAGSIHLLQTARQ